MLRRRESDLLAAAAPPQSPPSAAAAATAAAAPTAAQCDWRSPKSSGGILAAAAAVAAAAAAGTDGVGKPRASTESAGQVLKLLRRMQHRQQVCQPPGEMAPRGRGAQTGAGNGDWQTLSTVLSWRGELLCVEHRCVTV